MNRRRFAVVLYGAFLVVYSFLKYRAAAPPSFSAAYAQSTAILVFLTGVVPFVVTLALQSRLRQRDDRMVVVLSLIFATAFCMLGYAAYWGLFLADVPGVPGVSSVASRGIPWGLGIGMIAGVYRSDTEPS